ncbi:MAG TPA: DUF3859 domain-containing protein [Thermoanaerobaculia bacterium]|jgi:hypothetical protein|nr:DUF3859 domain-containing protein [Thermoanaerobaculia bacterium]
MALFHIVLPLLLAFHQPEGAHELDGLPESVRERATLIFAGTYVTTMGIAVRRGNMEVWPLIGTFNVKTNYLGATPRTVGITPHGHDLKNGRNYLVLLRPEAGSRNAIENGLRPDLTDEEIVGILYIPPLADSVQIVDFGTFAVEPEQDPRRTAPETSIGFLHEVPALETPAVREHTDRITGIVGSRFGLLFCAEAREVPGDKAGESTDDLAPIHIRVIHPPARNPATGQTTDRDEWDAPANLGITRFTGWRFDEPWEIVPGKWTIEILQQGTVMARKEFIVTTP